jgi:hypothetical protein
VTITQNAVTMLFGLLVAAAGLFLLFSRHEQAENKIKFLGQEFQISTPALVVFLVGSGIFILPFVMQTQNQPLIDLTFPWQNERPSDSGSGANIRDHEREPNDQITGANLIRMGSTIRGLITTDQDRDFFKVKTSAQGFRTRVILRKPPPGFCASVVADNAVENQVEAGMQCGEQAVSFAFSSNPNSDYYIVVKGYGNGDRGPYELLVKEE